jgi:hypothetical protein
MRGGKVSRSEGGGGVSGGMTRIQRRALDTIFFLETRNVVTWESGCAVLFWALQNANKFSSVCVCVREREREREREVFA